MCARLVVVALTAGVVALTVSGEGVAVVSSPPTLGVHWTTEQTNSTHPPDSALAVGPTDLIEATNAGVSIFDKSRGSEQKLEPIADFLRAGTWPRTSKSVTSAEVAARYLKTKCCVDPHALWDSTLHRFWFSAQQGPKDGTAYVFVALSKTAQAKDGWTVFALDETINSSGVKEPFWCDYDQIGVNAKTLFVSCDMFPFASGGSDEGASGSEFSRVRVISKSEFKTPACGAVPCSWWDLEHPLDSNGRPSAPVTPAVTYGTDTGDEYLLDASRSRDEITVRRISDVYLCCDGKTTTHPTVAKWYISIPESDPAPKGLQKRSADKLDLGSPQIHSAFSFDGWLYAAQTAACLDSYSCVQIDAIPLRNGAPVQPDTPSLRFGTPGFFDAYPEIAPTISGRMIVVYSQSGVTEYPSILFSRILPAKPGSGPSLDGTGVLKRGTTVYRHENAGTGKADTGKRRTVGDYFSAAIDPLLHQVWIRGNLGPSDGGLGWASVVGETTP